MSKIIVKFNRQTQLFEIEQNNIDPYYCDIVAGLIKNNQRVQFSNLSFGAIVKCGDDIIVDKTYPIGDIKYISSNQDVLEIFRVNWKPLTTVNIKVWMNQFGLHFETDFNINIPQPQQPYPSWTWNNETSVWESPIPYPQDGQMYLWDEDLGNWVEHIQ